MIVQENITINGRELVRTCSDSGMMILQVETGIEYAEAVDALPLMFTYEESENQIV
ncbi:MAG: hypothetical protein R3Y15_00975 [Rikenellaceae bacterium]